MGRALRDNETFDPFLLFVAERMRNPDDLAITTDWMNVVKGHPQPMEGETVKNEEGGQRDGRE